MFAEGVLLMFDTLKLDLFFLVFLKEMFFHFQRRSQSCPIDWWMVICHLIMVNELFVLVKRK